MISPNAMGVWVGKVGKVSTPGTHKDVFLYLKDLFSPYLYLIHTFFT